MSGRYRWFCGLLTAQKKCSRLRRRLA